MENKEFIIKVSKEDVNTYLCENIINSDTLTNNDKKVLAALTIYHITFSKEVEETGYFYRSNKTLRESVNMKQENMIKSIDKLIKLNLIERIAGEKWKKGKDKKASRYKVLFDNFEKPLKKLSYKDFIKDNVTQQTTQKHEEETEIPKNLYIEEYTYQKRDTSKIKKHLEFCKEHGLNAYGEAMPKKRTVESSQWLTNEDMINQICSDDNDDFLPF